MIKRRKIYRDAGTGRMVSKAYAEENPGTTVSETVEASADEPLPEEPAVRPEDDE
jgi:hypothetical protein